VFGVTVPPLVIALAVAVVAAVAITPGNATAHALLLSSKPAAGTTVGTSPTTIELTFGETPDPKLSTAKVLDASGSNHAGGPGRAGPGGGRVLARHKLAPAGAGVMVRDHGHVLALESAAMAASTFAAPHRGKVRRPPSAAALAAAATLPARTTATAAVSSHDAGGAALVDLAAYAAAAAGRNTMPH